MSNLHVDILQEYVDDELPHRERVEIARHLGNNAHDSALVDAYQRQNEALQRCYGDKIHEPLPVSLQNLVDSLVREPAGSAKPSNAAQSAAQDTHPLLSPLIDQAVQAYQFFGGANAQPIYQSHQEADFQQWFQDNLDVRLCSPAFSSQGYSFAHGQCLPMAGGTAGQFSYRHKNGSLLLTYFQVLNSNTQDHDPLPASVVQRNELALYYWQYEMVLYALVATMHHERLSRLAQALLKHMW